ncbi:hypothetical protein [Schleiferilactobacillus shenzhenensis]|uniref:Uncharacterized protein n=1 Tax=Schleiferilactobacillus shenzhenensis LY-73 TaxID=1231336 RepID=U4TR98_9LACO|nr:hypothetical protein [Schleiferilactobacillus shenzhenensis]ERL64032.1 hypothetical protein L248_1679 [Schleiferilactobacillus shenzhenensis LY-73]
MIKTLKDVAREVDRISKMTDDEEAHAAEDNLHVAVLEIVSRMFVDGTDPLMVTEMARTALETLDLPFARWYA